MTQREELNEQSLVKQRISPFTAANVTEVAKLKALRASLQEYRRLETYLAQVIDRLDTFTDEPRYDALIPLGPLAFMQGQLVHTNTIKVQLDDEHLVEYSAKQAKEVAKRRIVDVQASINELNSLKDQLTLIVDAKLNLPVGYQINDKDELLTTDGLACVDIEETETGNEETDAQIRHHNAIATAQEAKRAPLSMNSSKFWQMYKELEAEEAEEAEETEGMVSEDSPKHAVTIQADAKAPDAIKKSVTFDLPPESAKPPPEAFTSRVNSAREPLQANRRVPTPFQNPMKSAVLERPLSEEAVSSTSLRPDNSNEATEPSHHSDEKQSAASSDDEDQDSIYEYSDEDTDGEDITQIDELLLHRELALEYHRKRQDMLPALNGQMSDIVPMSASLAPGGDHNSASRFTSGPLTNAQLIIPTLLQQAQLKPGDILQDLPINSRVFTEEELREIERRAEAFGADTNNDEDPQALLNNSTADIGIRAPPAIEEPTVGDVHERDPLSGTIDKPSSSVPIEKKRISR